jgi:CRP-like cAMP-binding protein
VEIRRFAAAGQYLEALRLTDHMLASQPLDDASRLMVPRLLAALGFPGDAAEVCASLALHFARAGHPLPGLVAWRMREELGSPSPEILTEIARLYESGAPTLGPKSARQAPIAPETAIEDAPTPEDESPETVAARAKARALDLSFYARYPASYLPLPFFSELPAAAFGSVLRACQFRRYGAGETVIREGERGRSFFVVATGELRVTKADPAGDIERSRLHEGAVFGEMAVLAGQPRSASVHVVDEADVLELSREALDALAVQHPALPSALQSFARERLLKNLLATSPLFRPFDKRQQLDLLRHFEGHEVPAGTTVISEGQLGLGLFVVLAGEVEVTKRQPAVQAGASEMLLSRLRAGDVFGEMSLLSQRLTTASVRTLTPCTLLFLAGEYFQRLVAALPEIRQYFEAVATRRDLENRLVLDPDWIEPATSDENSSA